MAIFKKSPRRHHSHEPSGLKKFFFGLLILLCALAILGGFWFLSQLGPKDIDFRDIDFSQEVSEETKALQAESIELEAQFEEVLAMRQASPEDLILLKRSLDKQKEYVAAVQGVDSAAFERQVNLEERYQDLASDTLRRESQELEQQAEALAADQDYENARAKYREAYQKQRQINENYPLGSSYDVGRATRLERQARFLAAGEVV